MNVTKLNKVLLAGASILLLASCNNQEGGVVQFSNNSSFDLSSFIENFSFPSYPSYPSLPTRYPLNYVLNGGTNSDDNVDTYENVDEFKWLKNAWKDGYMFDGWYMDPDFNVSIFDADPSTTGEITIYAKWTTLPGFDVTGNEDGTIIKKYNGTDTVVTLPKGVVIINDQAFMYKGITTINLPETLTSIGRNAFYGCESLTEVVIPDEVEFIGDSAFCNCYDLKKVTLPKWTRTFGDFVFENCWSLEEVTCGKFNEVFGRYMFANCHSLTKINFYEGGSLWKFDEYALMNCTSLTDLVVLSNFQTFAFKALEGCTSLKNVQLGSGVKYIGSYSFSSCSSLEKIWIPSNVFYIGPNAFEYCNKLTIYCELAQYDAVRYESGWNSGRPVNWSASKPNN